MIDAPSTLSSLVGLQVVKIAGLATEDAFLKMRAYISADNDESARVHAPIYLLSPRLWKAIGVGNSAGGLDLELTSASGIQQRVGLFAIARLRYLWWHLQIRDRLWPAKLSAGSPPSAERRREPWWLTSMPSRRAVYVAFRAVRDQSGESLTAFGTRLLRTARAVGAERIVIDVRDNSGGDNSLFPEFVAAIAASEYNVPGRLFVLIDGGTFSAATNFVTTMERHTHAILAGTTTGSGPNHFGDPRMLILPRTRIAVLLSTRWHQFGDPDDFRTAHAPQLTVPATSRDYFAGRDAVLDAALAWRAGLSPHGASAPPANQ